MALKGLVIDQPWIGMILHGEKTWEMRSRATNVRGEIALIQKGTRSVVGTARLVDVLSPLRSGEMAMHFDKHRIAQEMVHSAGFKWFTPWVLTDVRRLPRPIPYNHPSGAVTWVNLSAEEEAAIRGSTVARTSSPASSTRLLTSGHRLLADRVVSEVSELAVLDIPANATRTVRRDGSKLYIDVQWDDDLPERRLHKQRPAWLEIIGMFGVVASAFCGLALVIHLPLAILSSSFTILGAVKWLPAMFVAMLVAVIGGHGEDLKEIFASR